MGRRPLSFLDRVSAGLLRWLVSAGLTPSRWPGTACGTILLEVKGRRSGRIRSNLVTWVRHDGRRYLVTMPEAELVIGDLNLSTSRPADV